MVSTAIALLVVVWSGHDIAPQSMTAPECEQAASAIRTAAHIRDVKYAEQSNVSVYCIPLESAADPTVYALLSPPPPPPAAYTAFPPEQAPHKGP